MNHASDLFSLSGRVAVVTGATGNLGPLWIETLLEAGARVFAVDRPRVFQLQQMQALYDRFGDQNFCAAPADVRDRQALEDAACGCAVRFGPPTVLVNSAGIDQPPASTARPALLEDVPADLCREVLEVNALGLFLCCQVFGGLMARSGGGSIVNIGSLYASHSPDARYYAHIPSDPPFLKPPAYGASKAAVGAFTRYVAAHWAAQGVRANMLSPGGVLGGQDQRFLEAFTSRVPMGRMAQPGDLKGPLLFLASDASRYVTGQELIVDGGYTVW